MSNSSDDRRGGRRPGPPGREPLDRGPTERAPGGYPPAQRGDVPPPPPRGRPAYTEQDYPDYDDDPRTGGARYADPRQDQAWQPSRGDEPRQWVGLEFEASPLRVAQARSRDIEPPVDPIDDAYREVMTGPPAARARPKAKAAAARPAPAATDEQDLYAPARTGAVGRERGNPPIVPAGSVTGRSLTLVIGIMCFLACLTAGAVYMINQSAAAWLKDIASEVTVQVEARDKVDVDKLVTAVTQYLGKQPGIRSVKPLSMGENAVLLEPWLGQADVLKSLPVPRLIAIEVDRSSPPDFTRIRTEMVSQFKAGVTLDDHRHWQQQIRTVTRSFALGGLAILMLVGAATTAIIVSATRSALSANREIVEVLHFVGATDRFIAHEFEKHFLRLGIRAGITGAGAAMVAFITLPFVMELLGGGTVTIAEMRRLVGSGALDMAGYGLLAVVVLVIATLCMLTSRIGVYRILNSQH